MEYSVFITSPLALGTLVRRNIDQVNYHLHSMATNLTHPKLKREFLLIPMFWNQLSNEAKLTESLTLRSLLECSWVFSNYYNFNSFLSFCNSTSRSNCSS